jgi:hypothetical protein
MPVNTALLMHPFLVFIFTSFALLHNTYVPIPFLLFIFPWSFLFLPVSLHFYPLPLVVMDFHKKNLKNLNLVGFRCTALSYCISCPYFSAKDGDDISDLLPVTNLDPDIEPMSALTVPGSKLFRSFSSPRATQTSTQRRNKMIGQNRILDFIQCCQLLDK